MKKGMGGIALILAGVLLSACSNKNMTEQEPMQIEEVIIEDEVIGAETGLSEETAEEEIQTPKEAEFLEEDEEEIICMENPSWDYFCESQETAAAPITLELLNEETNEITDTEEWFIKNDLQIETGDSEKYQLEIFSSDGSEECRIRVTDKERGESFVLDFADYQYADDFAEEERDYVKQCIRYAQVKGDVLYFSIGHLTYAASSPHNAYVAAVDLREKDMLWKSQSLVSNANNFVIYDDILICGYGFTDEPDYLYQLDLATGRLLEQIPIKSKCDYLILKDDILYVRTYHTDYEFQVKK